MSETDKRLTKSNIYSKYDNIKLNEVTKSNDKYRELSCTFCNRDGLEPNKDIFDLLFFRKKYSTFLWYDVFMFSKYICVSCIEKHDKLRVPSVTPKIISLSDPKNENNILTILADEVGKYKIVHAINLNCDESWDFVTLKKGQNATSRLVFDWIVKKRYYPYCLPKDYLDTYREWKNKDEETVTHTENHKETYIPSETIADRFVDKLERKYSDKEEDNDYVLKICGDCHEGLLQQLPIYTLLKYIGHRNRRIRKIIINEWKRRKRDETA